jgi:hypothetical protein
VRRWKSARSGWKVAAVDFDAQAAREVSAKKPGAGRSEPAAAAKLLV